MGTLRCSICGTPYVAQWALDKHETIPHHACPICGALRININQHISKAHREDSAERGRRISEGMRRRRAKTS